MARKTRKFNGRLFTKTSSHRKKSLAKRAAEKARDVGFDARVVQTDKGFNVFTAMRGTAQRRSSRGRFVGRRRRR